MNIEIGIDTDPLATAHRPVRTVRRQRPPKRPPVREGREGRDGRDGRGSSDRQKSDHGGRKRNRDG